MVNRRLQKALVSCVLGLTVTTAGLGTLVAVTDIPTAMHAGACDNPNFKACAECCPGTSCGTTEEGATCSCRCGEYCDCNPKGGKVNALVKIGQVIAAILAAIF